MTSDDLDEVLAIEERAHPSPWTRKVFEEELERPWARLDVARAPGPAGQRRVVAFCNYWHVRDEVHLLNLATHAGERRRGYGRALLRHLIDFALSNQCRCVTLEVRAGNGPAIALYEQHGFAGVGLRRNYYASDGEDALVMILELGAGTSGE